MKHYAGLDVSVEKTAVCMVDGEGQVVTEGKMAGEPDALAAYLSPWSASLAWVGLEAGGTSPVET